MREPNDWRLTTQEKYLKGVQLEWKDYARPSETWDHDHCSFCWAKFMDASQPEMLKAGYATPDEYYWVCPTCFEDFKDLFGWKVAGR